ncbi:hypothetical protein FB451DRAFT_1169051 [Mycena latifolia]|nr:hypothetical protein FB451DRAFT_1169051 [Mycena latifolia]
MPPDHGYSHFKLFKDRHKKEGNGSTKDRTPDFLQEALVQEPRQDALQLHHQVVNAYSLEGWNRNSGWKPDQRRAKIGNGVSGTRANESGPWNRYLARNSADIGSQSPK